MHVAHDTRAHDGKFTSSDHTRTGRRRSTPHARRGCTRPASRASAVADPSVSQTSPRARPPPCAVRWRTRGAARRTPACTCARDASRCWLRTDSASSVGSDARPAARGAGTAWCASVRGTPTPPAGETCGYRPNRRAARCAYPCAASATGLALSVSRIWDRSRLGVGAQSLDGDGGSSGS